MISVVPSNLDRSVVDPWWRGEWVKPNPATPQGFSVGREGSSPASIQGGSSGAQEGWMGWLLSHFRAVWFLSSMGAAGRANPPPLTAALPDVKQQQFQAVTSVLMLGGQSW